MRITGARGHLHIAALSLSAAALLGIAVNEGYLNDVPVNKVLAFEAALHAFFNSECKALMDNINATANYDGTIETFDEVQPGLFQKSAKRVWATGTTATGIHGWY